MDKKLIPVIGVAIVLVGIGAYYFLPKNGSDLPGVVENKMVEQEVMKNCKFDPVFCKYISNAAAIQKNGMIMKIESTNEDGTVSTSKIICDGKGNTETIAYENMRESAHTIYIDKYSYIKSPSEEVWTEYPPSKTDVDDLGFDLEAMQNPVEKITKDSEDTMTVNKIGSEKCGKFNCVIFTINTNDPGTTKIWIDDSQFLSRRTEYTDNGSKSVIIFDYGNVEIKKPSPIKTMPNVSDMMDGSGNLDMNKVNEMMKDLPGQDTEE